MTVDVILRHAVLLLLVTLDECDAQNSNYGTLIVKSPFLPDESISSDKRTPVYRPSGTNVTLECSRADQLIFLYRDEANKGNEISTNQQPMYTIYEVSFPLSNNRVYGCAKTTIGSLLSITLIVLAPPVLYNTTVEYKTGFGKISLECSAYGNPDPSVSIAYRDKIISPSSSAKAEKISVSGRVIDGIRNVVEVDINSLDDYTNSYACLVNNSQGNLTRTITIQPLALPTVKEIETVPSPVLIGSNFSLTCTATGNPLPTVVWIKPNASSNATVKGTLTSHQSYVTSVLVIRSAQYENSGKYECIAMTGPVYEDHASRVVTVADTPSYPADISVTNITSVSAVVIFKLQFDERFPILTSTIQLTLANSSQSRQIMTNGTFAVLKELDPYNAYYVEVLSTNALGGGEYSPRQLFWTDTAIPDGIPSTVMVSDINSTAVLVQWKDISKSKWNSPSRGYVIQYGSKSHEVQEDETQATTNISFAVISGLDEYTSYNFSVAAYNPKGKGGFSHSVSIRTKEDRPSAPPNNVAVVDRQSKSAVVFYDLPDEKDINGILLGFKVIAKNNGFIVFNTTVSNRTFNSDGVYTNVTGLRPYTLYTVQVVAFTEPGTGPWSQPVTFRTDEEKAGPPTKLQAERVYSIAMYLQWLPPDSPGNITRYLITYFGDNKNSSKFVEASRNNTVQGAVIHGLTANTSYTFIVYAVNSKGIGQASLNVSVATLPGSIAPTSPPSRLQPSTHGSMISSHSSPSSKSRPTSIESRDGQTLSNWTIAVIAGAAGVLLLLLLWVGCCFYRRRRRKGQAKFVIGTRESPERYSRNRISMCNTPNELRNGSNESETSRYNRCEFNKKESLVSFSTQNDSSAQLIPGSPSSTKSDDVFEDNKPPPELLLSIAKRPSEAEIDDALVKRRVSSPVLENPCYRDSDESTYENPYTPVQSHAGAHTLPPQGGRKSRKVRHDARVDNKQMMSGGTENLMSLNLPPSMTQKPVVQKSEYALPQDAISNDKSDYAFPQDAVGGSAAGSSTAGVGGKVAAIEANETYEEISPPVSGKSTNQKRSFFGRFLGGKKKQRVKSASALKHDLKGKKGARPGLGMRGRSRSLPGERPPLDSITETGEYETVEVSSSYSQQTSGLDDTGGHYEVVELKPRYQDLEFTTSHKPIEKAERHYEHITLEQNQTVEQSENGDTEIVDGTTSAQVQPIKPAVYSLVDPQKKEKDREVKKENDREMKSETDIGHTDVLVENPGFSPQGQTLQQKSTDWAP
jgi:hypothetical protein